MPTVKASKEDAEKYLRDFDWSKVDAMTDEDIAAQVTENPAAAPLMVEGAYPSKRKVVIGRPSAASKARAITTVPGNHDIDLAALRAHLGMTQAQFGREFGFSTAAVRSIEQGRRKPSGPTMTVLKMIQRAPDLVREAAKKVS